MRHFCYLSVIIADCLAILKKTSVVTLKIDNKQKIVELGICPDYGICKGTRKQDNLHCTNFVNK